MNKKLFIFWFLLITKSLVAKNIIYQDDIYLHQASAELVQFVETVAQEIEYSGDYELMEPKKAGLIINPCNRMISCALNPQTKNNFIIVNNDWFGQLSRDEQKFLIARCLLKFEHGYLPKLIKPLPGIGLDVLKIIILALFCLIIMSLFWLINRTTLRSKSRWIKWAVVLFVALILDSTVLSWVHQKAIDYLCAQYNHEMNQIVLAKLPNKQAAIRALECVDVVIKEGIKNGEIIFKPHENTYAKLAEELRKQIDLK